MNSNTEETKQQTNEQPLVHSLHQQESGSSSPSSTSSDDEKKQGSSSSRDSNSRQETSVVPSQQKEQSERDKQIDSPPQKQLDDANVSSQPVAQEEAKVSQEEVKQTSSDSEIVDFDEDDDQGPSMSSIVLEASPKGRFNRFGEELGRGAYKIVYRGIDNETGREIAWNVINLKRLPKQDKFRIKSEIDLIKKLEHKNIIHFISAWVNKEKEQVIFITEMITGGSLRKYVKKIKHPRLRVIKTWCMEILQGLVYLHDQKPYPIIHRDLKCDNIFINSNSGEIKIGDLGLSTPMQRSFTTSVLGTPEFMAPELYEECYGTGVDIYAFGMCVLEMITLERPYKECQNPAQIYNKVIRGIRPNALDRIEDEEIKDFILYCLSPVERRPTAKQLLESKFLKDLESEKNNREVKVRPPEKSNMVKRKKSIDYMRKNGSTIIEEEEEENSEEDEEQPQQVREEQVIQVQPLVVPEERKGQEEKTEDKEENKDQQQILNNDISPLTNDQQPQLLSVVKFEQDPKPTTQEDQQPTPITPQQEDPALDSSNLTVEANETEEQKLRKKKKSGSRNKKLNESVIFLKKIDKSKQQKMQERTRLEQKGAANDEEPSGDSGKEEEKIQENMLGELLQQERELEKMRYELEQSQQLQPAMASSASNPNLKSENDTLGTMTSGRTQLPYVSQYDSSGDYNKVKASQTSNSQQVRNSNEGQKREKKEANTIGKSKNFKEDSKQVSIVPQQKPAIPRPQTSTSNPGTMSDDLKRTTSKEMQLPSEQAFKPPMCQSQVHDQKQPQKLQNQQYQSSDSHLSNHSTSQAPATQQQQHKGPKFQPSDVQALEALFDVQSQSGEDSQKNDSEVDSIQLPKTQIDDIAVQNTRSNPTTPFNDMIQNRLSNEGLSLKSQLKKAGTTKQLNNQQSSSQIFNQNQQSQPAKTSSQSQSQIVQSSQQQQQQQQQKQVEQKINKSQSEQKPQRPSTEKQAVQSKDQQSIQPGRPSTGIPPLHPSQKTYQQQVYLHSSAKVEDKSYLHHITFKVRSHDGTQDKEVFFEFDARNDTAKGVAEEMVRELQLPPSQVEVIENLISSITSESFKPQPQPSRQDPPQGKQPEVAPQQQPSVQLKKDSPQKISKDTANTYFTKLFEHVDQFFLYMQNKSITSIDEITEAMDLPLEEAQMRAQFLNQILQAKRAYKRSIEEYKKKKEQQQPQKKQQTSSQALEQPSLQMKVIKQPAQEKILPPSQSQASIQKFPQQQQQSQPVKKQPDAISSLKRVGSKQDVGGSQFEDRKYEEKKDQPSPKESYLPLKVSINMPLSIRKHFKVAPQTVALHQKFSKALKQVSESPSSPDEEVQSLQHAMNIIFEASIIEMSRNPTNENSPAIQNYLPLRVDGYFGEKTEASVIKFQRHIKVPEDGIVTEQLWLKILAYIDFILKEDVKVQAAQQQQQQEKQLQQLQQQQILQSAQATSPQQMFYKDQPTTSNKQTLQQVINIATQVQLVNIAKAPKQTLHQPIQAQKSMSNLSSYGQQQKGVSPTKVPEKRLVQDIDYHSIMEQAFRNQNENQEESCESDK